MIKNKTILLGFSYLFVILFSLFCLSACDDKWTDWEIEKEPTCTEKGIESRYMEDSVNVKEFRDIDALGHNYGEWGVINEPSYTHTGLKARVCQRCGHVEEQEIPPAEYAYVISYKENGTVKQNYYIALDNNGSYEIEEPQRVGFSFVKFIDQDGNDFATQGVVSSDVVITAVWDVLPTSTFQDLKSRIENGATEICISDNIELTDTIFIEHDLSIYANADYQLSRSADFGGFLFVVGKSSLEEEINIDALNSKVTIYSNNDAKLVFDGNKENALNVYGSAFLITNSCVVNIEDNVVFQNFKKTSNRVIINNQGINHFAQVGGACFIIGDSATLNINGGEIKNNEANIDETLEYTYFDGEQTVESESGELNKLSCSGGAIYNNGTLNIYGGQIENNIAARGGAIFNYKNCNIYGGTLKNNSAEIYGGAVYLPASQKAALIIGSSADCLENIKINIISNSSKQAGGAIFGQTVNSILINGGVKFEGNISQNSNGGAIATSASTIIKNTIFENNIGNGDDSKGGALYAYTQDNDKTARQFIVINCNFISNIASKGGALGTYSATSDSSVKFATISVSNCNFIENKANVLSTSTGGAVYLSKNTHATFDTCEFKQNQSNKNGGAIYNTASSININNCTFLLNDSGDKGGAIAVHSGGNVVLLKSELKSNSSTSNGGALYLYGGSGIVGADTDEESVCLFEKNSAAGGGAIYVCATDSNAAELTIYFANLQQNTATSNGGAIYCYTNTVVNIYNIEASDNEATGNGGVFYISGKAQVMIYDIEASTNVADSGGVFYATSKDTSLTILGGSCLDNSAESVEKGYTIYTNSTSVVLKIKGTTTGQYFTYETDGIKGKAIVGEYDENDN